MDKTHPPDGSQTEVNHFCGNNAIVGVRKKEDKARLPSGAWYAELRIRVLEERLRLMRIEKYGASGEKLGPAQMELFELEPVVSEVTVLAESERAPVRSSTKRSDKHPGRQVLPSNLPRVERILPCTPDQRVCKSCGKETVVIGYEESSQLATGGTQGCGDSLGRGKLPQVETPSARLFGCGSPRVCRSPDPAPPRPYSRCVGCPTFIERKQGVASARTSVPAAQAFPAARAEMVIARAPRGLNDAKGFVFISHVGEVFPSGFLPQAAGNIRCQRLEND